MQQETTTNKRRMQDLTEDDRTATIADMELIIEEEAARREAAAAQIALEKKWHSVNVTLNPRAYAYVKGIASATGTPIRRVCSGIITREAEAHIDD